MQEIKSSGGEIGSTPLTITQVFATKLSNSDGKSILKLPPSGIPLLGKNVIVYSTPTFMLRGNPVIFTPPIVPGVSVAPGTDWLSRRMV